MIIELNMQLPNSLPPPHSLNPPQIPRTPTLFLSLLLFYLSFLPLTVIHQYCGVFHWYSVVEGPLASLHGYYFQDKFIFPIVKYKKKRQNINVSCVCVKTIVQLKSIDESEL